MSAHATIRARMSYATGWVAPPHGRLVGERRRAWRSDGTLADVGSRYGALAAAVVAVVILALSACTGAAPASSGSTPSEPGTSSPAGGRPATAQSSVASAWGAARHLDYSQGGEDVTSVSCPSASFCMAVLGSGYAAMYDGSKWSRPSRLSSSTGQPDSV